MPEAAAQERLDQFIRGYAGRNRRPPFRAHLTLVSDFAPSAMTRDALSALAGREPIVMERDGVLRTRVFSRSFALQFRPTPALLALRDDARERLGLADDGNFIPHISLTYGFENEWSELEAVAQAFAGPVLFNALESALHTSPFVGDADVAVLESLFRQDLGGI
jgi:hypothetical protein